MAGASIALAYTARNYKLAFRGQVTDRFTKALERLDSERMHVRLGGILALEQIAADAPDQSRHARQVLSAFLQSQAPRCGGREAGAPLPADVTAAVTALISRYEPFARLDFRDLDLSQTYFGRGDFRNAQLERVSLAGANLEFSFFANADLSGADLSGAWLDGAQFHYSKGLTVEQVLSAFPSLGTKLPNGIENDPLVVERISEVEEWKAGRNS
ncbi:pentapeptide repeat-containing protein [Streptomyces sp. NPDC058268]|uniref:pentapeptide repeat-containing protein n=1 Tax=Streptomyces sp. NPDC058268 TaxID=3346413 RepID=UPI0036E0F77A